MKKCPAIDQLTRKNRGSTITSYRGRKQKLKLNYPKKVLVLINMVIPIVIFAGLKAAVKIGGDQRSDVGI